MSRAARIKAECVRPLVIHRNIKGYQLKPFPSGRALASKKPQEACILRKKTKNRENPENSQKKIAKRMDQAYKLLYRQNKSVHFALRKYT